MFKLSISGFCVVIQLITDGCWLTIVWDDTKFFIIAYYITSHERGIAFSSNQDQKGRHCRFWTLLNCVCRKIAGPNDHWWGYKWGIIVFSKKQYYWYSLVTCLKIGPTMAHPNWSFYKGKTIINWLVVKSTLVWDPISSRQTFNGKPMGSWVFANFAWRSS